MADLKATLCGELPQNEFSPQAEQLIALLERRGIVEDPSIVNDRARQQISDPPHRAGTQ